MRSYKAARRAAQRAEGVAVPISFEVVYFDDADEEVTETFNAYGELSMATQSDFAYFADVDAMTPEAGAMLRKAFMEVIGNDEEFRRFWRVAAVLDGDILLQIIGGLIEDTTGRPTVQPSISPDLSSTTGQDSRVTYLHGGFQTMAQPVETLPLESSG